MKSMKYMQHPLSSLFGIAPEAMSDPSVARVTVPAGYTFLILFCYAILVCGGVAASF